MDCQNNQKQLQSEQTKNCPELSNYQLASYMKKSDKQNPLSYPSLSNSH